MLLVETHEVSDSSSIAQLQLITDLCTTAVICVSVVLHLIRAIVSVEHEFDIAQRANHPLASKYLSNETRLLRHVFCYLLLIVVCINNRLALPLDDHSEHLLMQFAFFVLKV